MALLGVGVAYYMGSSSSSPSAKPKPAETTVAAVKPTTEAAPKPEPAPLTAEPVLTPKLASVEINGAEAGTRIKLDGVLLGKAAPGRSLSKELPPGDHVIELSRNGFVTKMLARNLAPRQESCLNRSRLAT